MQVKGGEREVVSAAMPAKHKYIICSVGRS